MEFIKSIITFFKNLFWQRKDSPEDVERKGEKYLGQFVEELPAKNKIEDNVIYIVGEEDYEWLVALNCPCGCGDLIQLNLLDNGKYVWRVVRRHPQKVSISPSIDRTVGCKSHFTVTKGEVIWWENSF